jgi:hypothetical protein
VAWKTIARTVVSLALGLGIIGCFWFWGPLSILQTLGLTAALGYLIYLWGLWGEHHALRTIVISLAEWGALFAFFRYIGQLSTSQGLTLAVVVAYVHLVLLIRTEKAFQPYWIWIEPDWFELLHDRGVLQSREEWKAISSAIQEQPRWEYNVLRSGIRFVFLNSGSPFQSLIYRPDVQGFSSSVWYEERVDTQPIRAVLAKLRMPPSHIPNLHFYVRASADGYELGMTDGGIREERTKLALLPYVEFDVHRISDTLSFGQRGKAMGEWRKKRDRALEANGWKLEYEYLKHKYFTVTSNRA